MHLKPVKIHRLKPVQIKVHLELPAVGVFNDADAISRSI